MTQGSLTAREAEQVMAVPIDGIREGVKSGAIRVVGMLGNEPLYCVESIGKFFGRIDWRLSESQIHDLRHEGAA